MPVEKHGLCPDMSSPLPLLVCNTCGRNDTFVKTTSLAPSENSIGFGSPQSSYRSNSLGMNYVSVFSGLLLWCAFSLWSGASSHCTLLACRSVAPKDPSNGSVQLRSESYNRPNFVCGGVKGQGSQASGEQIASKAVGRSSVVSG